MMLSLQTQNEKNYFFKDWKLLSNRRGVASATMELIAIHGGRAAVGGVALVGLKLCTHAHIPHSPAVTTSTTAK